MKDVLLDLLPRLLSLLSVGFIAFYFGRKASNAKVNEIKEQAEKELSSAYVKLGESEAKLKTSKKEQALARTTSKIVSTKPAAKSKSLNQGSSKDAILKAIDEIIEESKTRGSK